MKIPIVAKNVPIVSIAVFRAKIDDRGEQANTGEGKPQRAINAALPVLILVVGVMLGLYVTGHDPSKENESLRDILKAASSYTALMWASLLAVLTGMVLTLGQRIMSLTDTVDAWYRGGRAMGFAMTSVLLGSNTAERLVPHFASFG